LIFTYVPGSPGSPFFFSVKPPILGYALCAMLFLVFELRNLHSAFGVASFFMDDTCQ
jgi:hypothetical protein